MEAAVDAPRKIRAAAARRTLPELVELATFTAPVHLVEAKATLDPTSFDFVDVLAHQLSRVSVSRKAAVEYCVHVKFRDEIEVPSIQKVKYYGR